ncbi:MAG: hypothetical protein JKX85_01305 [Phycisphaeraceae bacterium]|nr:hypothetical protein [Phycisphaeraceae bacterium]
MPPVTAIITATVAIVQNPAVANFLINLAIAVALGMAQRALTESPSLKQASLNRATMIRQPVTIRRVIYGQARVSGPIVFMHEQTRTVAQPGTVDSLFLRDLYLIVPLADHEVEEIGEIYFNERLVQVDPDGEVRAGFFGPSKFVEPPPFFAPQLIPVVKIFKHLGSDDQAADPHFISQIGSKWTENHRLRGVAYLAVVLTYNSNTFPTGIPNITAVVKGKKVFDPRTSQVNYSNNTALCSLDYLQNQRYGLRATDAEIDSSSFIAAANVCDEQVALQAGGTENRYESNGTFDTSEAPKDILSDIAFSMAGTITNSGGRWSAKPGAFFPADLELTERHARDSINVVTKTTRRDNFNGVKGLYVSSLNDWQPSDFPPVSSDFYLQQDGGERSWADIELKFTTSPSMSQRIAKIFLERARQQIRCEFPANLSAMRLKASDNVELSISRFGWDKKLFEVAQWELVQADSSGDDTPGIGVDLALVEIAPEVFNWNSGEETTVDFAPNTNLPNPFNPVAVPTGISLVAGTTELLTLGDGSVLNRLKVSWSLHPDTSVIMNGQIEVQWKKTSESNYGNSLPLSGSSTVVFLSPVEDGTEYDVRIRAINSIGVTSDFVEVTNFLIEGKQDPPPDVPNLSSNGTILTWTYPNPPSDLAGFLVRNKPGNNSFWGDAQPSHGGIITTTQFDISSVVSGLRTFLVKAVDTSGIESLEPAILVKDIGDPLTANIVEEIDLKDLGFPGIITNGTIDGNGDLLADENALFMYTGDDGTLIYSGIESSPFYGTRLMYTGSDSNPFYTDDAVLFYDSTVKQMVYVTTFSPSANQAGATLFLTITAEAANFIIEYRTDASASFYSGNDTAPMYSGDQDEPFYTVAVFIPWPGSITLAEQNYDIRVTTSPLGSVSKITAMKLIIDAVDITEILNNISLSAAGTRLPITKTYSTIKTVLFTLQDDGGAAVNVRLLDKLATGPLAQAIDASGNGTTASVDATVQGF